MTRSTLDTSMSNLGRRPVSPPSDGDSGDYLSEETRPKVAVPVPKDSKDAGDMKVFLQLRADVHAQALHNQGQRIREAAEALEERERIRGARIMMLQGEDNPDFPRVLDADLHGDQDQDPPDYQVVPDLELNAEVGQVAEVDKGEVIELHDSGPEDATVGQGEVPAGVQPEAEADGGVQPAAQERMVAEGVERNSHRRPRRGARLAPGARDVRRKAHVANRRRGGPVDLRAGW